MVSLADFNTAPAATAPSLSDFNPGASGVKPTVINADTASNMAAHTALLAPPEAVLATYNNVNTELTTGDSSLTMDKLLQQRAMIDHQSTYDELQRVLSDPGVSADDKATMMGGYIGMSVDRPGTIGSLGVTVAKQAAMTPGGPHETDETVHTTVPSNYAAYDQVDQYNGWVQKQINLARNAGGNEDFAHKALDLVTSMVPFFDQASNVKTQLNAGLIKNNGDIVKAFTLLGNNKADVRAAIAKMPVADRYDFAQKLINSIKASTGSLSNNPDMLQRMNQLTSYLQSGGYNSGSQVTDNIFSLLDATILLGPVKGLLKGGAKAVEASSALKRAALVEDTAVKVVEPEVTKVIKNLQLTYDAPSGPTIFVNKKGEGSADLSHVESPSEDEVSSAADIITENILQKFNKPVTPKTPRGDMADMVDALGTTPDMAAIRDEVRSKVGEILRPETFNDPDIVKRVVDGVGDTLKSRFIQTPKTYKATSSQLVRKVFDDSNVSRLAARTTVDHTSVSQVVKDVNPDKARAIHDLMADDNTGQVSKAMYGTDRADAIANDVLPEVKNLDGSVRNKVNMDEAAPAPSPSVVEAIKDNRGRNDLHPSEKASLRAVARQDFTDVVGMVPRTPMATVGDAKLGNQKEIVFHGSPDKFDKFDLSKTSHNAFFFTNSKKHAEGFTGTAGRNIYPATIDLKNPLRLSDIKTNSYTDMDKIVERAKSNGHDGVIITNHNDAGSLGTTHVAFNPDQIKAIGGAVDVPTGVKFDMVYGPTDGGFKDKTQALRQALFSLRKYGVTENEVEVLGKGEDGLFVPAGKQNYDSYLVRVKHDYEFTPTDTVDHYTMPGSKWNMFDFRNNFSDGKGGSLSQHFIPPSVTVPQVIFNSSSRAADRSAWYGKKLNELLAEYGKKFKTLDKRQQALVDDYRVEANNKSLPFNHANLEARGLNPTAIAALKDWKTTTDTMWWLENIDANKTARARGWQKYVDVTSDTDLLVKPMPNRGYGNGAQAYDTTQGKMVTLTKTEIDELYERGGTIAQTRETVQMGDETFDYLLVNNHKDGSYIRALRDDDATLAYRDGYYPVKYTDTYFIKQTYKKSDGSTFQKAIASAGSLNDAKALQARLEAADNSAIYNIHTDRHGSDTFDENNWSSLNNAGRSTQRVRGQRLQNATAVTDPDHVHIEAPEESVLQAIRSLANRTAFRDWLDTTKNRWLSQYGHLIEDQKGVKMWPEDARMIGKDKLQYSNAEVADAKATWRHVRAMEAGYVNLIDDASKNFFKNMANTVSGKKGWGYMEKPLLAASKFGPTGYARGKAFRFLLAANPLRQLPVQAMQALPILLATNPLAIPKIAAQSVLLDFMRLGGDAPSFAKWAKNMVTGLSDKEAVELFKHYEAAGFDAAVDANSLIRNQIAGIVDRTMLGKVKAVASKPLNFTQKYGFNAGENFLMKTIFLSEMDLLKKAGTKIDAEVLDNVVARARNLTGNMNKAGELPYNENALSMVAQFFQAPHKTIAQIFMGHQGLTGADRLKLGAAYVTTFGVGLNSVVDLVMNQLAPGTDPDTKELIEGGVFNLAMNSALSNIFGQTVKVDFSDSFRLLQDPVQVVAGFWHGLMTGSVPEILGSGASAGLVFGDNARVTNFVKQMMRVFTVDNDKKPEEMNATGVAFLNMFSGMSNYFRAQYAAQHMQSASASGAVVDYHVNGVEAWLKAAGFSTIDEIHQYAANESSYQATGKYKDDISNIVDTTTRMLARKGIAQNEEGWYLDMMSEAQRVFGNNPIYMQEFSKQIMYKAQTGENSIFNTLLKQSGYTTPQQFESLVNSSHLSDENKKILLDSKKQLEEIKTDGK